MEPTGAAVGVALEEGEPPGALGGLGRSQANSAQATRLSTASGSREFLRAFNRGLEFTRTMTNVQSTTGQARRVSSRYDDQAIAVLSREHLIQNKLAAGRLQDLADVERLGGKPK